MAILTIEALKKIVNSLPANYTVEHKEEEIVSPLSDTIEIDVSGERIILK